jgi:lia operon protein LiaG
MMGKNTLTRIVIVTAIVAVVSLGIAGLVGFTAGGFDSRQAGRFGRTVDERKTLSLEAIELLAVSSVAEDVRIVEGPSGSVEAWLHGTLGAGTRDNVPRLEAARSGSTAEIKVERGRPFGFGPVWSNLVLEVSVPKDYAKKLSAKSVSASIVIADHGYAGISLLTTSGDVRVGAVKTDELSVHTTSGALKIGAVSARHSDISSVSGEVEVNALSGDTTLHTTSGDVEVAFSSMPSRIDVSSTSGTLTLRFPETAGFALDARSTSGDISCKFPITISESQTASGRHALQGVVQTGSNMVLARTVSGDIRIER